MKNKKLKFLCHECKTQHCKHRDHMTEEEMKLGSAQYCNYGFERMQPNNIKGYLVNIVGSCEEELARYVKIIYKSTLAREFYFIETPLEAEELLELNFIKDIELNFYGELYEKLIEERVK